MPSTRRGRPRVLERREPGDHPGVRRAGDRAHDDRVEEDAELPLLLGHLERPVGEPQPAERVLRGARRDGVRRAARRLDLGDRVLPRPPDADVEARRVEPHVGAHDPAEQDVADLVVDRVGPVHPLLLHEPARRGRGAPPRPPPGGCGWSGTPPIETRVSAPVASTSGTMYSSLRILLPPNARPLLTSSRLAQIRAPPRWSDSRSSGCTGLGPNVNRWRGNSGSLITTSCRAALKARDRSSTQSGRPQRAVHGEATFPRA